MLKQYVFTEEELEEIKSLIEEAHDVIWVGVPKKGLTSDMRLSVLGNLSEALDILKGGS